MTEELTKKIAAAVIIFAIIVIAAYYLFRDDEPDPQVAACIEENYAATTPDDWLDHRHENLSEEARDRAHRAHVSVYCSGKHK